MRRHLACFINRQNLRPIRFPCNFRIILRFCRRDRQLQILRLSDAHFLCALNGYLLDCIAGNFDDTGCNAAFHTLCNLCSSRFFCAYDTCCSIQFNDVAPFFNFPFTFRVRWVSRTRTCHWLLRLIFFFDHQLNLFILFHGNRRSRVARNNVYRYLSRCRRSSLIILRHGRRDCAADQHAAQQSAKQFRHFFHVVIISLRSPHQIFIQLYYTAQPCICHRIFAGIPNKFTICSHLRLNRQILILCPISRFLLRTASSNVIINISFIVS